MNSILVNFSGHPLSEQAKGELAKTYSEIIDSNPVDLVFDENVEGQLKRIVENLRIKIDGSASVTIIPPGQATFAVLLVSYLHGIIGHFPNLCYLERSKEGVYLPKVEYVVQPQHIRTAGRRFRFSNYDL